MLVWLMYLLNVCQLSDEAQKLTPQQHVHLCLKCCSVWCIFASIFLVLFELRLTWQYLKKQ